MKLCVNVAQLPRKVCELYGGPAIPNEVWLKRYERELNPSGSLRQFVCNELTEPLSELVLKRIDIKNARKKLGLPEYEKSREGSKKHQENEIRIMKEFAGKKIHGERSNVAIATRLDRELRQLAGMD